MREHYYNYKVFWILPASFHTIFTYYNSIFISFSKRSIMGGTYSLIISLISLDFSMVPPYTLKL